MDNRVLDGYARDVAKEVLSDVERFVAMTDDAIDLMFIERLLTVAGGSELFADGFDVSDLEIRRYFGVTTADLLKRLLEIRVELSERKAENWYDTDVIPGYVSGMRFELDVARREGIGSDTDFELTYEYVKMMESVLGNFGYRESMVRERYGKKWEEMCEIVAKQLGKEDATYLRGCVKTATNLLVTNVNLADTSDGTDTRAFRSYYMDNASEYLKSKTLTLERVRESVANTVSYFSS